MTRDPDLGHLFRGGSPPDPPPEGIYAGKFLSVRVGPGLSGLAGLFARLYMPWQGKVFYSRSGRGMNLIAKGSRPLFRAFWPGYRYILDGGPGLFQAFPFRTSIGPGRQDPGCRVLRLEYDLPINPRLNVRPVLDELVEIEPSVLLGKAHYRWPWGGGWLFAFFRLEKNQPPVLNRFC